MSLQRRQLVKFKCMHFQTEDIRIKSRIAKEKDCMFNTVIGKAQMCPQIYRLLKKGKKGGFKSQLLQNKIHRTNTERFIILFMLQ